MSALVLSAALSVLVLYEQHWRHEGFAPSINDDAGLWCFARTTVKQNDRDEIVLIGASRMQSDIDVDGFATFFGGRKPVQLAISGSNCLPVFRQLSQDESYCGTVVSYRVPSGTGTGTETVVP